MLVAHKLPTIYTGALPAGKVCTYIGIGPGLEHAGIGSGLEHAGIGSGLEPATFIICMERQSLTI